MNHGGVECMAPTSAALAEMPLEKVLKGRVDIVLHIAVAQDVAIPCKKLPIHAQDVAHPYQEEAASKEEGGGRGYGQEGLILRQRCDSRCKHTSSMHFARFLRSEM